MKSLNFILITLIVKKRLLIVIFVFICHFNSVVTFIIALSFVLVHFVIVTAN